MKDNTTLAVIPARGGSKGVPGKNIRKIGGKPLIGYSIEAALQSGCFTKVIVSTDDRQIAEVAQSFGAEIPFLRPAELSSDMATSDSVILHALQYYKDWGQEFDMVCKLQPTSPLRRGEHIKQAFSMMEKKRADFVVSVCECEHSPLWTGVLDQSLSMKDFMKGLDKNAGRQALPTYYRLNGAIYWGRVAQFIKNGSFIGNNGYAYVMRQQDSIDIDSELDLKIAEIIMEGKKNDIQ